MPGDVVRQHAVHAQGGQQERHARERRDQSGAQASRHHVFVEDLVEGSHVRHGLLGIGGADRFLDRREHGPRILGRGADDEVAGRAPGLVADLDVRTVDLGLHGCVEPHLANVAHHPDHGDPRPFRALAEPLAERIGLRPELTRQGFVDDGDRGSVRPVAALEEPAALQGNAHGAQVVGAHLTMVRVESGPPGSTCPSVVRGLEPPFHSRGTDVL